MKLAKKTVNNHLTVLRRLVVVAKKRGLIQAVPEIEWLKAPDPEFDFLDFKEAERLLGAAEEGEWRTTILVALRNGMRQGEILALRWEDVDLVKGQLSVRRSVTREIITTPKEREVARRTARRRGTGRAQDTSSPAWAVGVLHRLRADPEEERGEASAVEGDP